MKILYKFTHKKNDGKVIHLAIRKPTRLELDDSDMMFSQFQSECVQRGILTKEMLTKKIKNFGGILSATEEKEYSKIFASFVESKRKFDAAKLKAERETFQKEIDLYYTALRDIEFEHEHLFDRTADVIARNRTILHLALLIGLISENGEEEFPTWQPIYEGDEFEERYQNFCDKEDIEGEEANSILSRISLFVTFWYYGDKTITEDDFKKYDELTRKDFDEMVGGDLQLEPSPEESAKPKRRVKAKV
jgi:hypothetical protein